MLKLKSHRILALVVVIIVTLSLSLAGCGAKTEPKENILKVGATPVPHAEILETVKPLLEQEGIKLEIVTFTDYVQPNLATDKGEIDANFFQHTPYLDQFNADHKINLVSIAKVHIEPMGIYSKKVSSVNEFNNEAVITIPNDPSNAGRALALLEKAGLIKLKEGVGIKGTVQDIVDNPKNLDIKMIDAAQLPRTLTDPKIAGAVINTNFALEASLNPTKDALFLEDKDSPYANILVVKSDRANDPNLLKLAKALNSPEVKNFIEDKYKGAIVPAF